MSVLNILVHWGIRTKIFAEKFEVRTEFFHMINFFEIVFFLKKKTNIKNRCKTRSTELFVVYKVYLI